LTVVVAARNRLNVRVGARNRLPNLARKLMQAPQIFHDPEGTPRLRKRRTSTTQTDATDFLDLGRLQVATAEQQRELAATKAELAEARRASVAQLETQVAGTAAERDARWARKLRTVEEMHAKALQQSRLAGEQHVTNELAKQREKLHAFYGAELEASRADAAEKLGAAHADAEELRGARLRLSEEVASLRRQTEELGAALEAERTRVGEVELRAVRAAENFARQREEAEASEKTRATLAENAAYVPVAELLNAQAELEEERLALKRSEEARVAADRTGADYAAAAAAAAAALERAEAKAAAAEAAAAARAEAAVAAARRAEGEAREAAEEAARQTAAAKAEAERQAEL